MSSDSQVVESWIASFCSLLGHEYFAEVSEDFIEDDFNLTGLVSQVPMYKEALEMILDVEPDDDDDDISDDEDDDDDDDGDGVGIRPRPARRAGRPDLSVVEASAELLYGLVHQRFINSRQGLSQMHEKYEAGQFGVCPRVFCNGCRVLPVGCSDTPGHETVKLFCPSCLDIYTPPNSRFQSVDGAFFGTTFGSLFVMTYPDLQFNPSHPMSLSPGIGPTDLSPYRPSPAPDQPLDMHGFAVGNFAPGLGASNYYEPRIYGFRVSEKSRTGPRMQWLRMKPDDLYELDEAAAYEAGYGDDSMDDGTDEADASDADDPDDGKTVLGLLLQRQAEPHHHPPPPLPPVRAPQPVTNTAASTSPNTRKKASMRKRRPSGQDAGPDAGQPGQPGNEPEPGTNGAAAV